MRGLCITARRQGKAQYEAMLKEQALDAGKTVYVVSRCGMTKEKRIKHLTSIETINPQTGEIRQC